MNLLKRNYNSVFSCMLLSFVYRHEAKKMLRKFCFKSCCTETEHLHIHMKGLPARL